VESWIQRTPYRERYKFIPLIQISPNLQRVVIAEKDARFYEHLGFDWHQIQIAAEEDLEGKRTRGASTITQQHVKNLFFGTGRSVLRKGAEFTLVPVAEAILGKQRILELYLNVVEWALVFMARMRPAITTTGLRPAISIRNRLHGSQLFCLLP
jgi:monofunctional biosynthetic peptidoglycan transglycosylase